MQHAEAATSARAPKRGGMNAGVHAGRTYGEHPASAYGDQCTRVAPPEGAQCSMGVHANRAGESQRQRCTGRACRCAGPGLVYVRRHDGERTGHGTTSARSRRAFAVADIRSMQDMHALMMHAWRFVHVRQSSPSSPSWSSEGGRVGHGTALGWRGIAWRAQHGRPRAGASIERGTGREHT
eukprot:7296852-Prymnesium_polylepis.2